MELSIVTTLYKSRPFLEKYLNEMTVVLKQIQISDYELVFVNDGSPDDSVPYLLEQKKTNNHIRVVDLSRNFGHHYALQEGIRFASGDYVYLADNDMEIPVSFFATCYNVMKKNPSLDFVYGVQEERKGYFVEKWGGKLFWHVFNKLADIDMPGNMLTECLMTRKFVDSLLSMGDANLFLAGMVHWVGFEKQSIAVKKGLREGKSTYTFKKRFALMIQALTSFSGKPLEWLFYSGVTITGLSFLFMLYLAIKKLVLGDAVSLGWTSLVSINVMILGIMTTFMGLIGMYVFRIYKQVQGRPNVIVRKVY